MLATIALELAERSHYDIGAKGQASANDENLSMFPAKNVAEVYVVLSFRYCFIVKKTRSNELSVFKSISAVKTWERSYTVFFFERKCYPRTLAWPASIDFLEKLSFIWINKLMLFMFDLFHVKLRI